MTFFFRFVICLLFSCKFGRRFPKMLSLEQTENGKANKPRDTLRFSQENSKNCHVQATCSLGSFFLWQTQMTEKVIFKLHRIVCVSVCMQISPAYIITLLLKVAKLNKNHFFFFFFSLCLECQGCWGGAPRSCRLLWVWAGTGLCGLERFYQEKEDTTPVPNTEWETKHALGTRKWLMFHVTVIPLDLLVALEIFLMFFFFFKAINSSIKRKCLQNWLCIIKETWNMETWSSTYLLPLWPEVCSNKHSSLSTDGETNFFFCFFVFYPLPNIIRT